MLQAEEPDTFVLATNRTETVRSFATLAYRTIGVDLEWRGSGAEECGIDAADGRALVRVDTRLRRPAEVDLLQGDNTRAGRVLGWTPRTTLEELAAMMVTADVRRLEETATIRPLQPRGRRAPLVSQAVA